MPKSKRQRRRAARKSSRSTGSRKAQKGDEALSRVERLLALLYIKGLQPTEAAMRLTAIGFTPKNIASLLGKPPNTVSQLISRARKAGQR